MPIDAVSRTANVGTSMDTDVSMIDVLIAGAFIVWFHHNINLSIFQNW